LTEIDLARDAPTGHSALPRRKGRRGDLSFSCKAIENVCGNDLVIIDEIGFAPLDHTGCQMLFRLVAACYERRPIAIGSHSPFEQWGRLLPDQPTAVSLLDRLCQIAPRGVVGL